jgi:hypothetical protein
MDDGHARSQNKQADVEVFEARQNAWFDHYLKGAGQAPASSVEALTTTCGTPSAGPYTADSWKNLAPGEIRLDSAATQTIVPGSGDPSIATSFDPIGGGGACATASGADQTGAANYRLPPTPAGGFTLIGSPTVVADISSPGGQSELAARLLDVSPGGTETLVARGLLRPGAGGNGMVFQLHPQAFHFAPEHVAKLELLPSDSPYARASNAQAPITISNLQLRLPVLEPPGSLGGLVQPPAPKIVPPGYELAIDYRTGATAAPIVNLGAIRLGRGGIRATKKALLIPLRCTGLGACAGELRVSVARRANRSRSVLVAQGPYSLQVNQKKRLRLPLGKAGRRVVASYRRQHSHSPKLRAHLDFNDPGHPAGFELSRVVHVKR